MSGITGISVAAPQIPQAAVAVAAAAGVATLSKGASGNAADPAVILNLSSAATASAAKASPALRSMDPIAVEDALARVAGANGFAFMAADFDEAHDASQCGEAIAQRDEDQVLGAANESAQVAISAVQGLGLPVKNPVGSIVANLGPSGPPPASGTATSGYFTVSDFSFTSGGSTYSITTGANGMLTGTKDGQYWMALETNPSEWQSQPPSQPTTPLTPAQAAAKAAYEAGVRASLPPVTYYIADGLGGTPASTASAGSPPTGADPAAVAGGSSNGLASNVGGSSVVTSVAQTGEAAAVSVVTASSTGSSQASQLLTTSQSGNLTSITPADAGAETALTTLTAFESQRTSADKTAAAQSLASPADAGAQAGLTILTAFNAQRTSANTTATGQSPSSLNLLI